MTILASAFDHHELTLTLDSADMGWAAHTSLALAACALRQTGLCVPGTDWRLEVDEVVQVHLETLGLQVRVRLSPVSPTRLALALSMATTAALARACGRWQRLQVHRRAWALRWRPRRVARHLEDQAWRRLNLALAAITAGQRHDPPGRIG